MLLPKECKGCPLYNARSQFIPDKMPYKPAIIVWFDAPPSTFSGQDASEGNDGQYFHKEMAPFLQIDTAKIGYAHLMRCRAASKTKGKPLTAAKAHCRVHDQLDDDSTLLTPGFLSWQYFTQRAGSRKDWGGFYVEMQYNGTSEQPTPKEKYREFNPDGDDDSLSMGAE